MMPARIASPPSQWKGSGGTLGWGGVDEGEAGVVVAAVEGEGGEGSADHVGWAYAVAGVAGGGEGAVAAQGEDQGEVGGGGVDRAAPGVGEGAALEAGEVVPEVVAVSGDDVGVELGAAVQAGAHRDVAAAPAEGDAAVGRGAEVVDQGAAVGDALAAGPADLLEQLGHRLGEDDVRGGDGEPVVQRPARRLGGGPDREHGALARTTPPAVCASTPVQEPASLRTGERS